MSEEVEVKLDVTGVCCPMPIIQLAKATRELSPGRLLRVTGNDPIFETSVRDFCQSNGHTLLDVSADDKRCVSMLIRIGG